MKNEITAEGWIYEYELIVLNCPLCGLIHRHGNVDYKKGDVTTRLSHCNTKKKDIKIEIQGELTSQEYNRVIMYYGSGRRYEKRKTYFVTEEDLV